MKRVDTGDRVGNRAPKEKQRQIVRQRNTISLRFGPGHIATKSSRFPRRLKSKNYNHGHTQNWCDEISRGESWKNHAVVMVEVMDSARESKKNGCFLSQIENC